MTDFELNKKNAKGFSGLSSMVSDVSEAGTSQAKTPEEASLAPPAVEPPTRQPARAEQHGKGFAGLSSMVSDVYEDAAPPAKAPKADSAASLAAGSAIPHPAHDKARLTTAVPSLPSTSGKTVLALIVAAIVVVAIWAANSGSGDHGETPATPSQPEIASLPDASMDAATNGASVNSDEQWPPVGRDNVLSIPQIRWCKREKIRIDAIEGVVNIANEGEVVTFNSRVDDYNSRCGEFRYRQGAVEQVERELALERESVASTAKIEWAQLWPGILDAPASAPAPAERADEPESLFLGRAGGGSQKPAPSQIELNQDEQASIDSACSGQRTLYGQAAYDRCVSKKKSALKSAPRSLDLTALSAAERESIESACGGQGILDGPAAYNICLSSKLAALKVGPREIDLSALSPVERESIESACSGQKFLDGPAVYNQCLSRKLAQLKAGPRNVDLSNLSDARREWIESACSGQKYLEGPAAYNKCLTQKLGR